MRFMMCGRRGDHDLLVSPIVGLVIVREVFALLFYLNDWRRSVELRGVWHLVVCVDS